MAYCCRIVLILAVGALVTGPVAATAVQDRVYVAVADSKHKPVAGLTAADFRVAIDGREQEIASVARPPIPCRS